MRWFRGTIVIPRKVLQKQYKHDNSLANCMQDGRDLFVTFSGQQGKSAWLRYRGAS